MKNPLGPFVSSPSRLLPSLFILCNCGQNRPATRVTGLYKINYFLEYGHVAYQIKGNEAYTCNNMLANNLLLHLPLNPGVGSKGQFVFFSESSHVADQLNWNEA